MMKTLYAAGLAALLGLGGCQPDAPAGYGGEIAELRVVDERVGDGAVAEAGATVVVRHTSWLYDPHADDRRGEQLGQFARPRRGVEFRLGAERVIRGLDEGVVGMRVGGRRTLYIPPDYAYGGDAVGAIPPDSSLVLDVELLDVRGAADR